MKIHPVGAELLRVDGRIDMAKLNPWVTNVIFMWSTYS